DIYFRAVLTSGQFSHYELQNVECFFGKALISAYRREKEIPAMGLFIDDTCMQYNRYFRTADFGNGLHFVYLNRHLEYLHEATGDKYPLKDSSLVDGACFVPWQVRYLKDVHKQMRSNES